MTEQTDAAEVEDSNAAFYAKHYSDWTVHALPLMVYVPTGDDRPKVDAMELVQEILTEAAFDIRIEPLADWLAAREAAARAEALREAADDLFAKAVDIRKHADACDDDGLPSSAMADRLHASRLADFGDWLLDRIARTDGAGS
jgi:hypothetical protein